MMTLKFVFMRASKNVEVFKLAFRKTVSECFSKADDVIFLRSVLYYLKFYFTIQTSDVYKKSFQSYIDFVIVY